jgi:hypothetical protein
MAAPDKRDTERISAEEARRIDGTLTPTQRELLITLTARAYWRGNGHGLVFGFIAGSAFAFASLVLFRLLN